MILGINGRINSGKDTVGSIIQYLHDFNSNDFTHPKTIKDFESYIRNKHNLKSKWEVKKFAHKLKQIASLLTGIPIEKFEDQEFKNSYLGKEWETLVKITQTRFLKNSEYYVGEDIYNKMTVREFLQKLGTDCVRDNLHPNTWVNALFQEYDRRLTLEEEKRLLSIWKNINTRCTNSNCERYDLYGGKGICNEWITFESFKDWAKNAGYTNELTIDRIDRDKNYTADNCRWVTANLQAFNQGVYKNSNSGFRGVSQKSERINKYSNTWVAQIQYNSKKEHLGYFNTSEEALIVYNKRYKEIEELLWKESLNKHYKSPNIIITDVRFFNEAQAIKDRDGIVIRINRREQSKENLHTSEIALDDWEFDYIIDNNGTIEELINKVKETIGDYIKKW